MIIKTVMIFRALMLSTLLLSTLSHANEIQTNSNQTKVDIRWQDTDGKTHHLEDSKGKPRMLHFWAAWCSPCREELPDMIRWQKQNSDIQIIPLSLDQRIAQTEYFINKY